MTSKDEICRKIEEVIPEAGRCDIDFHVDYDKDNHAWVVDIQEGRHHLKTFVEDNEADECVDSDRCLPLGLQIGLLKHNLKLYRHC